MSGMFILLTNKGSCETPPVSFEIKPVAKTYMVWTLMCY